MKNTEADRKYEEQRLRDTIALAGEQLRTARERRDSARQEILEAKKEMRENTDHAFANLYSSDDFEALAELSQYADPVTNMLVDFDETEHKISRLEKLMKSPYFARIDFRFDGEDEYEQIYIGRSSLKQEQTHEMYVYDWRSPIAGMFYRFVTGPAFYQAPAGQIEGTIRLKRQYEIHDGGLEFFFDADVEIVDEFLRQLLSDNTSAKMKSVVETIQKEQDVVIRDLENDLLMVQGVAGSGKTSIALHRTAYLMYQGLTARLGAENILIISPNTLFEQYISEVLPELGEENVRSAVFEDIMKKALPGTQIQSRNEFLEELIASPRRQLLKDSIEFKTSAAFTVILERLIRELPETGIEFSDVYFEGRCIITGAKLKAKTLSGLSETTLGAKLKLMEEHIFELMNLGRKKRIRKQEKAEIKEQLLNFLKLDIKRIYRRLFRDRAYLQKLGAGLRLPADLADIIDYTLGRWEEPGWSYADGIVLTYLHCRIYGVHQYKNIRQVVIDEAQDYYPLQFEIFSRLFKAAKFTVLGDVNQTLEKTEDLSLYEHVQRILAKPRAALATMNKSFRCTSEILDFGLKFLDHPAPIESFNRHGAVPQIYAAATETEYEQRLLAEIADCRAAGYGSVGLICKTGEQAAALAQRLQERTAVKLITRESEEAATGTFVIPIYMAKGLEFDAVLLCGADADTYHDADDRNLLYVASTRALHRLNVFCQGEPSPLLP